MRIQDILLEQQQFWPVRTEVRDLGEHGLDVKTIYQWGSRQISVSTSVDWDWGPKEYFTGFFDLDDDDPVAAITNIGGKGPRLDYGSIGNPSYHLPKDIALGMYKHHFAVARPILDRQRRKPKASAETNWDPIELIPHDR